MIRRYSAPDRFGLNSLVLSYKTSYLSTMSRKCISLFSGAMGLDLGLEAAGLKTAVAVEKNKVAVATIKLNRGESLPVIDRAIETVETEEILRLAGLYSGEAFLVTGGPCCQSFSTAGKRRSLGDVGSGQLFRHFKRIVLEARPRFFVMENVKGMLSAAVKHRPLNERGDGFPALGADEELGSALKVIRKELAELNYRVIFGLVNCADYGVPQKRFRVIFLGSRDGEKIALPAPTHSQSEEDGLSPWVTLKDAIGGLDDPEPEFLPFSNDRKTLLEQLTAGQNWHDLPKRLHRAALGAAADTWGGEKRILSPPNMGRSKPNLDHRPKWKGHHALPSTQITPIDGARVCCASAISHRVGIYGIDRPEIYSDRERGTYRLGRRDRSSAHRNDSPDSA